MKGIESVCAERRANYEASSGQHLVRRAGGRGRDIYRVSEEIKRGEQVNTPAAPARGRGLNTAAAMKGGSAMDSQHEQQGMWIGWIILLVILDNILYPILGPINDLAALAIGGFYVLKRR